MDPLLSWVCEAKRLCVRVLTIHVCKLPVDAVRESESLQVRHYCATFVSCRRPVTLPCSGGYRELRMLTAPDHLLVNTCAPFSTDTVEPLRDACRHEARRRARGKRHTIGIKRITREREFEHFAGGHQTGGEGQEGQGCIKVF